MDGVQFGFENIVISKRPTNKKILKGEEIFGLQIVENSRNTVPDQRKCKRDGRD